MPFSGRMPCHSGSGFQPLVGRQNLERLGLRLNITRDGELLAVNAEAPFTAPRREPEGPAAASFDEVGRKAHGGSS